MTKRIIVACGLLAMTFMISCKADSCVECEKKLVNSTTKQEICDSGTGITVTTTLIGIASDTTIENTTVDVYKALLELDGYTCK